MHLKIILLVVLAISLVGVTQLGTVDAATHTFELDWGEAGISKPGSFLSPQHLAFDSENNVYVTDLGNSRVQKFDSSGEFLTEWGTRGTDNGEFGHPMGIAVSGEFVFVVDNKNHNVQKFDLDGNFISKWGAFGNDNGSFKSPRGITVSEDSFVYVVDSGNARVQKFTSDGEYVSHFGQSGKRGGNFVTPVDIAINSDKIYVTDPNQNKIIVFDLEGNFEKIFNDSIGGYSINPEGIVFDKDGNFYIVDYKNNRIIHYNDFGVPLSIFGQLGNADGHFKFPKDVAMSNDGYLYVTDTQGHRIQKFVTPSTQLPVVDEQTVELELNSDSTESLTLPPVTPIPNDFQKPTILVPEDVLVQATGPLTDVNIGEALATDESGISSLSNNAPSSFPLGINTIIWTAVDGAGNMAIASQTVTVQDTIPPKISPLEHITLEAKSSERNLVNIGIPEISDEVGVISITNDAPEVFPLGETIVTWTATDSSGNSASATQTITVVDTTAPILEQPDNVIFNATSKSKNVIDLQTLSATDSISDVKITNDAPSYYSFGETIVTWTATDSSGNSASAIQTITVVDTTAPKLNAPENITIDTESIDTILEIGSASVSDIIDDSPSITNDAPEVFPLGETIVTWTATDKFGNISSSTQIISVQVCGNSPSYYNMIIGTDDDDLLIGTTMSDLIFAKGGDDIISADKGNDCIIAGDGDDIIFGNEGNDHIFGQGGNDIIKGHSGEDFVFGGYGLDMIDGGEDIDTCKIIDEQNFDIVIRCESNE